MPTGADLAPMPAERGVRVLALSLLDDVVVEHGRFSASDDADALHDFRVALRRLCSCLRAYRPELDTSVSKRTRRDLDALADAAGVRRDLDVRIAWLEAERAALSASQRHGADALRDQMDARRSGATEDLGRQVAKRFARATAQLRDGLSVYETTIDHDSVDAPSFGALANERGLALRERLDDRLAAVRSADDDRAAHRARITAKRFRYLLEPVADVVPEGAGIVEQLRALQDALGEMHDAHVFFADLMEAIPALAGAHAAEVAQLTFAGDADDAAVRRARRRTPMPGLVAIGLRLRARAETAFAAATPLVYHLRRIPSEDV